MSHQFSGSLATKRKGDLVEIASAMGLSETDGNMADLKERIQAKLDSDADSLRLDDRFKGLYTIRRRNMVSDEESPVPEKTPARGGRRNKILSNIADAANIPLPDSPLGAKIQEAADGALALVESDANNLNQQLTKVSDAVSQFAHKGKVAVEVRIRDARDFLSRPAGLIPAALLIEEALLFTHVAPFTKKIVTFPPPVYERGSFDALLRTVFFWVPRVSWAVCFPKLESLHYRSPFWPAESWWIVATVIPPLVLSILISFVPQKGVNRSSATTRYQAAHPPTPTVDDLTFVFVRLAILLLPLTNAAPKAFVEALEVSGNSQARALGAGLLAALVLAHRFGTRG